MNALIITVAGLSTRFSKSVKSEVLKCIYFEGNPKNTLLYHLLENASEFDCVVIVGGHRYDELREYAQAYLPKETTRKTQFVFNDKFDRWGSGQSLYVGLESLQDKIIDNIVFAEGDLRVDAHTLSYIYRGKGDLISCSPAPVRADNSVALFFDKDGFPKYVYDTSHELIKINEPFKSIHSSGQIWRFGNQKRLMEILSALDDDERSGTNLVLINRYFQNCNSETLDIANFRNWINCNTISEYREAFCKELTL